MVLLAIAVLVVSVLFFSLRASPAEWRSCLVFLGFANATSPPLPIEGSSDQKDETTQSRPPRLGMEGDPPVINEENEDQESTPKATPQNAKEQPTIPQFQLDVSDAIQEKPTAKLSSPTRSAPNPLVGATSGSSSSSPSQDIRGGAFAMPPPPPPRSSSREARSSGLMAPPPVISSNLRPLPKLSGTLMPPPSAASSLRAPPGRQQGKAGGLLIPASTSTLPPASRPSRKVLLDPGHSPLDWAHIIRNPPTSSFLRGVGIPSHLIKVPPSQLRVHNGRKGADAWGTWQGRVYNLTPYLKFHPGGVGELMRGAGKAGEAERLFNEIHPWVNWEGMLGECLLGILVSEGEEEGNQHLEEMD